MGASHCQIGSVNLGGVVSSIQDLANNKRTEQGEDNYVKCVLGCMYE